MSIIPHLFVNTNDYLRGPTFAKTGKKVALLQKKNSNPRVKPDFIRRIAQPPYY